MYLSLRLEKPLLVEGQPGSGKTELGYVLARGLDTKLIRLQCYEGLTVENAMYEWNYTKQLLSIKGRDSETDNHLDNVFSEDYLLERPLLEALRYSGESPPVLLIDEIDRADEPFEAFLLEFLANFQVTIPELGAVQANQSPIVFLTSNRTRELSDALKRRCLYLHISPPSLEKERKILQRKVPSLQDSLVDMVCRFVEELREEPLIKPPGISEVLDWARALDGLYRNGPSEDVGVEEIKSTLGCLLKRSEDINRLSDKFLQQLLETATEPDEFTQKT